MRSGRRSRGILLYLKRRLTDLIELSFDLLPQELSLSLLCVFHSEAVDQFISLLVDDCQILQLLLDVLADQDRPVQLLHGSDLLQLLLGDYAQLEVHVLSQALVEKVVVLILELRVDLAHVGLFEQLLALVSWDLRDVIFVVILALIIDTFDQLERLLAPVVEFLLIGPHGGTLLEHAPQR